MLAKSRMPAVVAAAVLSLSIALPASVPAMDTNTPSSPPQTGTSSDKKSDSKKKRAPKKDKKSEQQFIDDYRAAHALIYQRDDFAGGIAALRALDEDDHPDVANLIGFASRKLGRYDDARYWYEQALASDPNHALTWSYYGMWHAEQGNLLKAQDHLTKVASICGTQCREYVILKEVIEGTRVY